MGGISSSILTGFYNFGKDSRLVGMSTDVASLVVRSPLTLLDKKTDKETRTHAALWQGMDYSLAIALQMTIFPLVPKAGKFLAKNMFKYKDPKAISGSVEFFNFFIGYFILTSVLMPLLNSSVLTKLANFVSEKLTGKKIMPNEEKTQQERKEKFEIFKQKIINKIKAASEKILGQTITNTVINTHRTVKNAVKLVLKPVTAPVENISRLIGKFTVNSINFVSNTVSNKQIIKNKDKASEGFSNFFKKVLYFGLSLIPIALLGKKFGPALGKKLEKFMVKENNISSTVMLIRTRIADGTAKPLILLASGAPYMAMRKFVDQIVSVIFLKGSEPMINKATKLATNTYKLDAIRSKGFQSMLVTLFQTFFLLNIALPLFNNAITGRLFKLFSKEEKADSLQQEKQNSVKQNDINKNAKVSSFNKLQPFVPPKKVSSSENPFKHFEDFIAITDKKLPSEGN